MFSEYQLAPQTFFQASLTIRLLLSLSLSLSISSYPSSIIHSFLGVSSDVLALITRMRAVVMVDYGGIMPQLQHHLSSLLQLALRDSPSIFEHIRVMVIQDMIYLIHITEIAHFVRSSFNSQQHPLLFVDLEHQPPKVFFPTLSPLLCLFYFLHHLHVFCVVLR